MKSGLPEAINEWKCYFADFLPDFDIYEWNDPGIDPMAVRYALVWDPEDGWTGKYPNLKAILSSSAGVDHILKDPNLRTDIPIVRMVAEETQKRMAEFVGMSCLLLHKEYPKIIDQQKRCVWREVTSPRLVGETTVGIMGLGALGGVAAEYLTAIGFKVSGWSRTPKKLAGVTTYSGKGGFAAFLARANILVCLLPATEMTRAIIDLELLYRLPEGASVVDVGRGSHLVEDDLLKALKSGHISFAALDVLNQEPPALSSPFWNHPQVLLSPHSAATPSRREKAKQASISITSMENGREVVHVYDPTDGY